MLRECVRSCVRECARACVRACVQLTCQGIRFPGMGDNFFQRSTSYCKSVESSMVNSVIDETTRRIH